MNRKLTFALAMLLLANTVAGCGTTPAVGDQTDAPNSETTPIETGIPGPDIAAIDGGGRDFTFIGRLADGSDFCFPNHEILAEEQTGDTMNDAVYKRNLFIEEKYNINIVALEEARFDVRTKARNAIKAGDNTYDVIMANTELAFSMQLEGAFYNVDEIPQVDISKPWWQGRVLFWVKVMYGIYQIREMVSDFGIIPPPKYDEKQESYASYVHTGHSSSIGVPVTNDDLALTGAILEDMAYQSYVNVRPAFYDITLKGKLARDEETVLMLDIIYNNINPDLTLAMNASGLTIDSKMRSIFTEDRSDIVSLITANKEANIAKIEANTEAILSLLK